MSNSYESELITLNEISEQKIKFNIPIYQRLYVWKEEQVKRLLEDTYNAFKDKPKESYYLGAVIVVKNGNRYDLIDGQQRFTTLWLISNYLQSSLTDFLEDRLHFSIRDNANRYFKNERENLDKKELKQIENAEHTIINFFEDKEDDKEEFSTYLNETLELVFTSVPTKIDLNKLFEVINSGGVQLQHHELLKAKMLEVLKDDSKEEGIYSKLWESCAFMENYLENNLAVTVNCTKKEIYEKHNQDKVLKSVDKVVDWIETKIGESNSDKRSLQEILSKDTSVKKDDKKSEKEDEIKVRSIISFPMLLLHTLRILLHQNGKGDIKRIREKELLQLFSESEFSFTSDEVKAFIKLLWQVRYVFDRDIIKWVEIDDGLDEHHLICKVYENKTSTVLQRVLEIEESKSFSLLQSMLYHTQETITHYWLTPLLSHILNNKNEGLVYLQKLDNYLFFPNNGEPLQVRTWNLLKEDIQSEDKSQEILEILNSNLGTKFSHYLFYKVEYILWCQDKNSNFYFRAKNSVEHIEPQTKDEDKVHISAWTGKLLDSFSNLALVSRERNSEFGNLTFDEKKSRFKAFKDSNQHLKMGLIYKNDEWTDILCKEHHKEIENNICEYIDTINSLTL